VIPAINFSPLGPMLSVTPNDFMKYQNAMSVVFARKSPETNLASELTSTLCTEFEEKILYLMEKLFNKMPFRIKSLIQKDPSKLLLTSLLLF
jgi:hypothetical protein